MKQKFFSFALCMLLLFSVALAQDAEDIHVTMDGTEVWFDTAPIIENGRTMVPMRAVLEAFGMRVEWDEATQTATAVNDDVSIICAVGQTDVVTVTEGMKETFAADQPPIIKDDRILVPIRFISEALGASVDWKPLSRTVVIMTDSPKSGIGRLYYEDGITTLYCGEIQDGLPNGKGTYYYEDGSVLCIGEFTDGEMDGFCTVYGVDFAKSGVYAHGELVTE